jgi:hypothetical protein
VATRPDLDTTQDATTDVRRVRTATFGRRVFVALLVLFLALGLAGLLGVKSATRTATTARGSVEVHYALITRPGLTTPLELDVRAGGGFSDDVTLSLSAAYLDAFAIDTVSPQPSSETTAGSSVLWTFDQPPGETLAVRIGGQIDADANMGRRHAEVAAFVNGAPIAKVTFTTLVLP